MTRTAFPSLKAARGFRPLRWIRDVSIAKKLYFTVGIMALLIGVELFALFFSLNTLSALRAYVGGEGLWSKAQKDAVYHLYKYGVSRNDADFVLFQEFMQVPLGDSKARQELFRVDPNMEVARQGFLQGRNHADDIDGMIGLFRNFHDVSYIERAITIWGQAEAKALEFLTIAERLRGEIRSASPSREIIDGLLRSIDRLNQELTKLEDAFSYTLGEGSRWLEGVVLRLLFAVALTVEITGLLLAVCVSRGIQKGLADIIRAAGSFAKGIYGTRAAVFSRDEIGTLAGSFNSMADELERSIAGLEKAQRKFKVLLEAAPDAAVIADGNGTIRLVNTQAERLFGYDRSQMLGRSIEMLLAQGCRPTPTAAGPGHVLGWMEALAAEAGGDVRCRKRNGQEFPVEVSLGRLETEEGPLVSAIIRDISERKQMVMLRLQAEEALRRAHDQLQARVSELAEANQQLRREILERERAEAALRESRRFVERVTEVCPAMIYIYEPAEGGKIYCNREVEAVLGYTPEQIHALGRDMLAHLVHAEDRPRLLKGEGRLRALAEGRTLELEYRMRHADTTWRWLLGRNAAFARDAEGRVTQVIGAAVDITARKAAEERIAHLALHDALTGLPNRALLQDRLTQELARARRTGARVGVMLLDLDEFKDVNDSFGHDAGDRLLRAVAERIGGLVRASDTLARVGGDEFALIQSDARGPEAAAALARKILVGLALPFDLDGQEVHASASLGIALFPEDGRGPSDLLRSADLALYRAKQEGRRRCRLFDAAMDTEARTRRRIERELRRALDEGELALHYQPQLDLESGRFAAVEALVRWNHPKRGLVPPGEFVPVAEASGLIHQLGAWVLREACRQARAWHGEGLALSIAVNVSPAQLRHPDGLGAVDEALHASGLDPCLLELEITEGLLVELSGGATGDQLEGLARRGVRLAIDDFGTGYSSLAYLKRLPVQRIKIDRSFVGGIGTDLEDEAVVQAIVGLGHSLGKSVVAEGVESEAQLAFLRRLRCDAAQGFLLGRPQPVEQLERLLAA